MDQKLKEKLEKEGYKMICEVKGKGVCALYSFMYTVGLVVGLDIDSYESRYCYPREESFKAVSTLLEWRESKEEIKGDPKDEYWIKRKRMGIEYTNPRHKSFNPQFD